MVLEIIVPLLIIAVSIGISAIIWLALSKLIHRISFSKPTQDAILALVRGPIIAAVIGLGVLEAANIVYSQAPTLLPFFLQPDALLVIVELSVLALAIRAASSDVKRLSPIISEERPVGRMLYFAIYTIGLIALSQIILSSPLAPRTVANIQSGINFLAGLLVTYLVVYILDVIIRRYVHSLVASEPRLKTMYTFIRRLVLVAVALIGVAATTFTSFPAASGVISSLFIAAGFSSIVVGLAAQSSLSNIIGGMLVSVSQPFKIGDAVVFKNEFCFVEDIKLVHTVLRTWDNRRLMVPNSMFQTEIVANYTAEDSTMLVPVMVQISYESDIDKAMSIMREIALKHPECMPIGNLPNVVVMDYGESGINLRLLSRAKDQPTAFGMARDILYQIKKEFDANGIEIPYPRRYLVLSKETERMLSRAIGDEEKHSEGEPSLQKHGRT